MGSELMVPNSYIDLLIICAFSIIICNILHGIAKTFN